MSNTPEIVYINGQAFKLEPVQTRQGSYLAAVKARYQARLTDLASKFSAKFAEAVENEGCRVDNLIRRLTRTDDSNTDIVLSMDEVSFVRRLRRELTAMTQNNNSIVPMISKYIVLWDRDIALRVKVKYAPTILLGSRLSRRPVVLSKPPVEFWTDFYFSIDKNKSLKMVGSEDLTYHTYESGNVCVDLKNAPKPVTSAYILSLLEGLLTRINMFSLAQNYVNGVNIYDVVDDAEQTGEYTILENEEWRTQ